MNNVLHDGLQVIGATPVVMVHAPLCPLMSVAVSLRDTKQVTLLDGETKITSS